MKRLAVSAMATALIAASGSASAYESDSGYDRYNDYNDDAGYNSGYDSDYGSGIDAGYDYRVGYRNDGQRSDTAQVVRVDPIIDRYRTESRQHCWIEQSRYDDRRYYNHGGNTNGALLGAVVGGALGNTVGKGDGRTAATIAGAVIGGSIGYNAGHYDGYNGYRDGSIRRCETTGDYGRYRYDDRVVAYNVTYRYAGNTYHTITNYHPGSTLRVTVNVQPEVRGVAYGY